ncbi:Fe-S cluster assembly protein SufD [Haliangium ochraceum]|uniref:FeS assembly protein SufD n=1 Tax=Haliangium ochraceum (strain DSM 14365 / JCM 11303 / SMP-2) TaxID=502025 RepID=D0LTU0_HALO1|nr:Fe-S cluster assembly protein SufD [Haliangium ochraceum]ACY15784.1 FeS assembly protein SufD [Haliangium ochraceum DSM 14365]
MSAAFTSKAPLLADLGARVPADLGPGTSAPAWLGELRAAARDVLAAGLPTNKHEGWRFTPLRGLNDRAYADAGARDLDASEGVDGDALRAWANAEIGLPDDAPALLLVDGRPLLPGGALPAGVELSTLAQLCASEAAEGSAELAELAAKNLGRVAKLETFSALNAALFADALIVRLSEDAADRPLHIAHIANRSGSDAGAAYPRVLVAVAEGARACVVESVLGRAEAPQLACAVTEITLAPSAELEHVRVHHHSGIALQQVARVAVRQDQGSSYRSRVVTLGGKLSRLDLDVAMTAPEARCELDGVYHAGRGEHLDHYTTIDHQAPRCSSQERYRGIIAETGHAVFDGTIMVQQDAQHSDAHQENRNLLLDDDAVVHTKPHLRIDADDVSCSHGATVGSLDDAQLFYLRSRGIGDDQARAVLTFAFVRELIDEIGCAPLREALSAQLRNRLPHGDTLAGLFGDALPE